MVNYRGLALILSSAFFLLSIVPLFPNVPMTETDFGNKSVQDYEGRSVAHIGLSAWKACIEDSQHSNRTCLPLAANGGGYNVTLTDNKTEVTIPVSATSFLQVHWTPVGFAVLLFRFVVTQDQSLRVDQPLLKELFCVMPVLTGVAFGFDIGFWLYVRNRMEKLGEGVTTDVGIGFWFSLGSLVCIIILVILEYYCNVGGINGSFIPRAAAVAVSK